MSSDFAYFLWFPGFRHIKFSFIYHFPFLLDYTIINISANLCNPLEKDVEFCYNKKQNRLRAVFRRYTPPDAGYCTPYACHSQRVFFPAFWSRRAIRRRAMNCLGRIPAFLWQVFSGLLRFLAGNHSITGNGLLPANTWVHLAPEAENPV